MLVTWPEFCRKGPRRPAQQTTCHVTVPELSGCVSRPLVVTEVVAEGVQGSQQLLAAEGGDALLDRSHVGPLLSDGGRQLGVSLRRLLCKSDVEGHCLELHPVTAATAISPPWHDVRVVADIVGHAGGKLHIPAARLDQLLRRLWRGGPRDAGRESVLYFCINRRLLCAVRRDGGLRGGRRHVDFAAECSVHVAGWPAGSQPPHSAGNSTLATRSHAAVSAIPPPLALRSHEIRLPRDAAARLRPSPEHSRLRPCTTPRRSEPPLAAAAARAAAVAAVAAAEDEGTRWERRQQLDCMRHTRLEIH